MAKSLDVDEFVLGTLTKWMEEIQGSMVRLHKKMDGIDERLRQTEIELARIKVKMGIVAATIALVVSGVMKYFLG